MIIRKTSVGDCIVSIVGLVSGAIITIFIVRIIIFVVDWYGL